MHKHIPTWKLWLLRWLALYPTLLLVYFLLQPLEVLPLPLRVLITSCIGTLALSFFWMPLLTRTFTKWLQGAAQQPTQDKL
jgi:antibiotic biosynthesis monooxygenase (ABM) superfamily enzyme